MEASEIERRNNRLGSKLLKPTLKAPADPQKKTGTDTFLPLTTALMGDPCYGVVRQGGIRFFIFFIFFFSFSVFAAVERFISFWIASSGRAPVNDLA